MNKKRSVNKTDKGFVASVLIGVTAMFGVGLAFLAVEAYAVLNGKLTSTHVTVINVILQTVAVLVGCLLAAIGSGRKSGTAIIATAAISVVLLLGITIFAFDSQFDNEILGVMGVAFGCGLAILIDYKRKYRGKRVVKKSINR